MEALLQVWDGRGVPAEVVDLADEMAEDPRCRLVLVGADAAGVVMMTLWDGEVVEEVAQSLGERRDGGVMRRLQVPDDMVTWR